MRMAARYLTSGRPPNAYAIETMTSGQDAVKSSRVAGLDAGAPGEVGLVLSGERPVNVVIRAGKRNNRAGL